MIEDVEFDGDQELVVVSVRPTARARGRCGVCRRPARGYDQGRGRRRWRTLDLGTVQTWLEADAPRLIFQMPYEQAEEALDRWVSWAGRSRLPAFVKLQKSIVSHKTSILAAIEHGLSNGRIESVNAKIRLITRVAFGFKSPHALIALAMLGLGGHRPELPGRK